MTQGRDESPSFTLEPQDDLAPQGPWRFLKRAVPGGFSRPGLELIASWTVFFLLSNVFWALHLKGLTEWSGLPNYWGELLTARDLWELVENGGLKNHWSGALMPLAALGGLAWFLWAGWRLQAATVGLQAKLGAWLWGFLDAMLIGALPLLVVGKLVLGAFSRMAASGIQGLGWLDLVGGTLVRLACLSALFLQWWLCRLDRADRPRGFRLGSWKALGRHLGHSFLRFWMHPVQWSLLVLGGVILRTGLSFLVLLLAWRWGGGTPVRVWAFLGLQVLVVMVNAWLLGWFLRLVALFGRHDAAVRAVILQLQSMADGGDAGRDE